MAIRAIKPTDFTWFDYSRYSFSLGVSFRGSLYLSGHTASEFDAKVEHIVVNGDISQQVRTAYRKIEAILAAARYTFSDVVRVVEYLNPYGIKHYDEVSSVRQEVLGACNPTVNTVPVRSLLRNDAFIEIEITASTGGRKEREIDEKEDIGTSGLIFLPTITSTDHSGDIVGLGDIVAQTEAIMVRAQKMLADLGLSLNDIVKTVDYITPSALGAYRNTKNVRRAYLGPVYPAAAGIVMPRLFHRDALVQYDFIASRSAKKVINPGWLRYDKLTYNPGILTEDLLFLSGQGAINLDTEEVECKEDVVAQAEFIYNNILSVVEAAGGNSGNIIKTVEYVVPNALQNYKGVGRVRSKVFCEPYPASTGIVCESLLRPEMLLEVDSLAAFD